MYTLGSSGTPDQQLTAELNADPVQGVLVAGNLISQTRTEVVIPQDKVSAAAEAAQAIREREEFVRSKLIGEGVPLDNVYPLNAALEKSLLHGNSPRPSGKGATDESRACGQGGDSDRGQQGHWKAIARRLAEEGANVVIAARSREVVEQAVEELRERTGGNVEGIVADVTDTAQVRNLMSRVNEKYGRLHILVNNAGKATGSYFEDISYEEWRSDFDLKVFGAIRCCREAIPYIKDSGGGSIINITASNAKTPGASSLPERRQGCRIRPDESTVEGLGAVPHHR